MFAFDTQGVLKGLNTGWEALRYTFTFTLWKPDPECASDQHTWNAAIGPAWLASGASWAAGVVAAPGIAARLAPNAARFLDPAATAAASTLVVENAENPAAEEEEINEFGTDCLNAIEGELQNAERRITVSRWGRPGLQPGDWVMKGKANFWNYLRSFKYQPGFGNKFAPFSAGEEFQVPASSVKWHIGRGIDSAWKDLFRQRMYIP